jgi:hypothetical protein
MHSNTKTILLDHGKVEELEKAEDEHQQLTQ